MDINNLAWFILVGLIAGFLAGQIMRGRGFGLVGNIIIGIVGALLGGFLFDLLGVGLGGTLGSIIMATFGAIILLLLLGATRRARI
ncbi:GlsB/YeaQ/YmgE family stress response membrane protein [bacterium]|nr:MAG: GlsB/YeaQ/YmgE family stress response membrane protein [bacterium]